jgi:hypothetical protein
MELTVTIHAQHINNMKYSNSYAIIMYTCNCLYTHCNVKEMRFQFVMENDIQMFFKSCNLNFSTCYKVCSIHGIEIVLSTRR